MVKAIISNDCQLFIDLGGLEWEDINIEVGEMKLTPIGLAISYGYKIMVQLMINNERFLFGSVDVLDRTVYHLCAQYDRLEIMDMLYILKGQVIQSTVDKRGDTPLHIACKYAREHIVRYILENAME